MKSSDLPKDKRDSVRVNRKICEVLKAHGLSPQKVLDMKLDELIKIGLDINLEEKKK